ncbi:hypothetical protein RhiirC2_202696 [Rhizophagus irregularis]|uniref:Uncharacterized protein n=1 Tax=Rhizophagus irregularis TaxID=588596 RepID=A0A2N1MJ98_9GLOM|nr:hypothetical protein RhiirC2_202696 [Rhizophagus irregularis]
MWRCNMHWKINMLLLYRRQHFYRCSETERACDFFFIYIHVIMGWCGCIKYIYADGMYILIVYSTISLYICVINFIIKIFLGVTNCVFIMYCIHCVNSNLLDYRTSIR